MRRVAAALALALLAAALAADAQPAGKVYRVGLLVHNPPPIAHPYLEAFRQGMRDLGWIEGQNWVSEERNAEGRIDRLPHLVAELVRLRVDVIVVAANTTALAAKQATTTIPIVMAGVVDPVGIGLVASLAQPGGNITGLSMHVSPEIGGKRLQLLKEAVPGISRVAFLWNPTVLGIKPFVEDAQAASGTLRVKVQSFEVRNPGDFEPAFAAMIREADALQVFADPVIFANRRRIVEFAVKNRLPAIYSVREFADDGGLMAYAANYRDMFRRAATYVHKILKGAKPADLPVEQPTKFELVINMKTAKALGLTIPPSVLMRADKVIE